MPLLMKYSSRTSHTLISLANGTSRTLINLPLANRRYIHQWKSPIDEWLVLAYGRDQLDHLGLELHVLDSPTSFSALILLRH
jgi:hypothetical protein